MGKKAVPNSQNIYEVEKTHKKHRKKSKKLEKREQMRKNKKKMKHERHYMKMMEKHIKQKYKDEKLDIDMYSITQNLDFEELKKNVNKLIKHNPNSAEEIPELFRTFDQDKKAEIDLSELEDYKIQKYITKLMKKLKLVQNPKNPYSFRVNVDDKMAQLSSYYLFVKGFFEFLSKPLEDEKVDKEGEDDQDDLDMIEEDQDDEDNEWEDDGDSKNKITLNTKTSNLKAKVKHNDDNEEMKYEYELMEEKFGKNSELINKAFNNSILNDNQKSKDNKDNNITSKSNNTKDNKKVLDNIDLEDDDEELCGPPVKSFLANTLNLIKNDDDKSEKSENYAHLMDDDSDNENTINAKDIIKPPKDFSNKDNKNINSLEDLINGSSFSKRPQNIVQNPINKIEPINKVSYDRQMAYEKERMKE